MFQLHVTHQKLKCNNVYLSDHAKLRLRQRAPQMKQRRVWSKIKRKISEAQRRGAKPDWDGAVHVRFEEELWAVCYPMLEGGWEVATIIREGRGEDMEERARYGGGENNRLESAIEYLEDAIKESDEIIADCSDNLKEELSKQKEHFITAVKAMRILREAEGL